MGSADPVTASWHFPFIAEINALVVFHGAVRTYKTTKNLTICALLSANLSILTVFVAIHQNLRCHYLVVNVFAFRIIVVIFAGKKWLLSITSILQNKKICEHLEVIKISFSFTMPSYRLINNSITTENWQFEMRRLDRRGTLNRRKEEGAGGGGGERFWQYCFSRSTKLKVYLESLFCC